MCSRIIHLFYSTAMDRVSLFSHSPIKDFSLISSAFNLFKSATSPVQCTSPFIMLQTCKRHTSFSAKIRNLNRPTYALRCHPIFVLSQTKNLAQSFLYSMNIKQQMSRMMSQRSFSSQRGSPKRTGSYPSSSPWERANRTTMTYIAALAVAVVGLSYAAVPLYRIFCQASGYGGTVNVVDPSEKVESMEPVRERELTIRFNADTSAAMRWQFRPHQKEIKLVPGETALAFYTARNPTDKPVTGIATYNVIPFEAGLYFNKIQCFCFEEQRLNPREQVDMPVFFYIDPEFNDDPALAKVDTITLSYTFFESKEGEQLSLPLPQTATNS